PPYDCRNEEELTLAHLKLCRARQRVYLGVIVFVHTRLERPRPDRILGAQSKAQHNRVSRSNRIEVENGLRCRQAELLQPTAFPGGALLLVLLQVLTEQYESSGNANIPLDHVCRYY